jgi:hypothetical protein
MDMRKLAAMPTFRASLNRPVTAISYVVVVEFSLKAREKCEATQRPLELLRPLSGHSYQAARTASSHSALITLLLSNTDAMLPALDE